MTTTQNKIATINEVDLNTIETITSFGSESSIVKLKNGSSLYISEGIDSLDYITDVLNNEGIEFETNNQYQSEEYGEDMSDLGEWIITIK